MTRGTQCAGIENMFVFGVDAKDINRLREERKDFKVGLVVIVTRLSPL